MQAALIDILNDVIEDGIAFGNDGKKPGSTIKSIPVSNQTSAHVVSFIDAMTWDYGLYDALEKTVTSTDSIHSTCSNHQSTLLRTALGLTTQISLLLECSEPQALFSLIDHVSSVDPDAAQWILQECHRCLGHNRRLWTQKIKLYVDILTKSHAENVKAAATSNLADILESFLEVGPSILSEVNTATIRVELALLPNQVSRMSTWGRDIVDSDLRLHGCVLAFQFLSSDPWNSDLQILHILEIWCLKLRYAIQDESVHYTASFTFHSS